MWKEQEVKYFSFNVSLSVYIIHDWNENPNEFE